MATISVAKNANLDAWKRVALQQACDAAEGVSGLVSDYPPALTPVTVAQFLLESDWGRHSITDANNFFGIKARDGEPFVAVETTEFVNGKPVKVVQNFRKYSSASESFADHARLICERTSNGKKIYSAALGHPSDPIAFAQALTGIYATDPEYGNKLVAIMRDRGLLETFGYSQQTS
ncbi:MAG TPA: glucosaminidase domain-containing protein [Gemmatimonadaceae bacterium]|jgi:flagellum-specific peptidoglycan hydrolase FlgJ